MIAQQSPARAGSAALKVTAVEQGSHRPAENFCQETQGFCFYAHLTPYSFFVMTTYICSFSFTAIHQELHGFARNRAIISPSWNYFHTLRFSPLSRRAVSFSGNSHNTKVSCAQPQSFKRCPKLSIYLGTAPLAVLASFPHWQGLAAAACHVMACELRCWHATLIL